jgi:hypothetical protein
VSSELSAQQQQHSRTLGVLERLQLYEEDFGAQKAKKAVTFSFSFSKIQRFGPMRMSEDPSLWRWFLLLLDRKKFLEEFPDASGPRSFLLAFAFWDPSRGVFPVPRTNTDFVTQTRQSETSDSLYTHTALIPCYM